MTRASEEQHKAKPTSRHRIRIEALMDRRREADEALSAIYKEACAIAAEIAPYKVGEIVTLSRAMPGVYSHYGKKARCVDVWGKIADRWMNDEPYRFEWVAQFRVLKADGTNSSRVVVADAEL